MRSLSGLGIGLGVTFGCLLLAMIAELYYLIWWKRRLTDTEVENDYSNKFLQFICFKRPYYLQNNNNQEIGGDPVRNGRGQDIELGLRLKVAGEDSVEAELMRLHNLAGPPRFLFTIKEETKEDLESEDGKSRGDSKSRKGSRTRSLSDIILAVDTPFVSPLASPPLKASLDSFSHHGFNPFFESTTEAELNRLRSSPPPKFKFMRDAERKLQRKLMEEAERKKSNGICAQDSQIESSNSTVETEWINGSFVNFLVSSSNKEKELLHHLTQYPSSNAQGSRDRIRMGDMSQENIKYLPEGEVLFNKKLDAVETRGEEASSFLNDLLPK